MQQLTSKIVDHVVVQVGRENDTIRMNAVNGQKLMEYLVKESAGSHVNITDIDGSRTTLSKHEIKRITEVYKIDDKKLTEIEI